MTFVSPGRNIKARHRFDPDAPEVWGVVKACSPVCEEKDVFVITFESAWDIISTISTDNWDVRLR